MKFEAILTTRDGGITQYQIYSGQFIYKMGKLRVLIYDNHKRWMTYDPAAFVPIGT